MITPGELVSLRGQHEQPIQGLVLANNELEGYSIVALVSKGSGPRNTMIEISTGRYLYPAIQATLWTKKLRKVPKKVNVHEVQAHVDLCLKWPSLSDSQKIKLSQDFQAIGIQLGSPEVENSIHFLQDLRTLSNASLRFQRSRHFSAQFSSAAVNKVIREGLPLLEDLKLSNLEYSVFSSDSVKTFIENYASSNRQMASDVLRKVIIRKSVRMRIEAAKYEITEKLGTIEMVSVFMSIFDLDYMRLTLDQTKEKVGSRRIMLLQGSSVLELNYV